MRPGDGYCRIVPRKMISTPYPTVKKTAAEVGVGSQRVRQLHGLIDAIVRRKSVDLVRVLPNGRYSLVEFKAGRARTKSPTKSLKRYHQTGIFVLKSRSARPKNGTGGARRSTSKTLRSSR